MSEVDARSISEAHRLLALLRSDLTANSGYLNPSFYLRRRLARSLRECGLGYILQDADASCIKYAEQWTHAHGSDVELQSLGRSVLWRNCFRGNFHLDHLLKWDLLHERYLSETATEDLRERALFYLTALMAHHVSVCEAQDYEEPLVEATAEESRESLERTRERFPEAAALFERHGVNQPEYLAEWDSTVYSMDVVAALAVVVAGKAPNEHQDAMRERISLWAFWFEDLENRIEQGSHHPLPWPEVIAREPGVRWWSDYLNLESVGVEKSERTKVGLIRLREHIARDSWMTRRAMNLLAGGIGFVCRSMASTHGRDVTSVIRQDLGWLNAAVQYYVLNAMEVDLPADEGYHAVSIWATDETERLFYARLGAEFSRVCEFSRSQLGVPPEEICNAVVLRTIAKR